MYETHVTSVNVINVIEVKSRLGKGTQEDVVRIITEYYSLDGALIYRDDPCADSEVKGADK